MIPRSSKTLKTNAKNMFCANSPFQTMQWCCTNLGFVFEHFDSISASFSQLFRHRFWFKNDQKDDLFATLRRDGQPCGVRVGWVALGWGHENVTRTYCRSTWCRIFDLGWIGCKFEAGVQWLPMPSQEHARSAKALILNTFENMLVGFYNYLSMISDEFVHRVRQ